ncbi:MAG: IS200/IS605 family transposase [FCB group bacterium]|jgi:REP element-mobilizing transposase RayT|nr:IS200/IS605 family transposase [FCB group bacterium]
MGRGSTHVFSEIYIHLNWHCKDDRPLIVPELEPALHEYIESYCRMVKGIHFKGVGGTEDHVHLLFQMEPFVTLSDFIGRVKGASSHEMNVRFGKAALDWQRGYGVVSFAARHLPGLMGYVEHQKEHHRCGTVRDLLEAHGELPVTEDASQD